MFICALIPTGKKVSDKGLVQVYSYLVVRYLLRIKIHIFTMVYHGKPYDNPYHGLI